MDRRTCLPHLTRHLGGLIVSSRVKPGKPSISIPWTIAYRNGPSLTPILTGGQAPSHPTPCWRLRRPGSMASSSPPTTPAPATNATATPKPRGPGGQQEYSCILCKQRKVRCDRLNPCSGCVRAGVSCLPGVRQPYKRRRKQSQGGDDLERSLTSKQPRGIYSSHSRALDSTSSPEESRLQRQVPTFGQYDPPSPGLLRGWPRTQIPPVCLLMLP